MEKTQIWVNWSYPLYSFRLVPPGLVMGKAPLQGVEGVGALVTSEAQETSLDPRQMTTVLFKAMVVRKVFFFGVLFGCFFYYFPKWVFLQLLFFLQIWKLVFFWVFFSAFSKIGVSWLGVFFSNFQKLVFFCGCFFGCFFCCVFFLYNKFKMPLFN